MKTIELKIYKFEELDEQAQKYAIKKWIESESEYGDPLNFFDEVCNEKANEKGFFDCEFEWSLGYCQGDGLSFSFKRFDNLRQLIEKYTTPARAKIIENYISFSKMGGNDGHYSYASENDIEMSLDYNNDCQNVLSIVESVESDLKDLYYQLCQELEKDGYEELEYQLSEENARESIIANEYDFTENGKMY